MIAGKEILVVNRKIWLHNSHKSNYEAVITKLEGNLFWVNLPQENKQPLILSLKQNIKLGVALDVAHYTSETTVEAIGVGKDIHKFYGLLIPENFTKSRERDHKRLLFSNNVTFKANHIMAPTTMIDFSPGGIQVYVTPKLEEILQSNDKIFLHLQVYSNNFQIEVRLAWRKNYNNIPIAGFKFINAEHLPLAKFASLALKYTL